MTPPSTPAALRAWLLGLHPGAEVCAPVPEGPPDTRTAGRAQELLAAAPPQARTLRDGDLVVVRARAGGPALAATRAPRELPGLLERDLLTVLGAMPSDAP